MAVPGAGSVGGHVSEAIEQTAICRNVAFGVRDIGRPILAFDTYTDEHMCALQTIEAEPALQIMKDLQLQDFKDLEGRPCVVKATSSTIRFVRFWKKAGR